MKWFDVIKDEDSDEWKKTQPTPKTYRSPGGLVRRNRLRRRKGQTRTNVFTGESFTPGEKSSAYAGRRVPTRNYENSCCQRLKQELVKLVDWRMNKSGYFPGTLKDLGTITRHINSIPCHEINEYMEPPSVEDSNFYNLEILGVPIAEFTQEETGKALGVSLPVYEYLYKDYNECLDDIMNMGMIKPPSELTDPAGTKFQVKGPDGELIDVDSKEPMREFEGFKLDSGGSHESLGQGGRFQEDEKTNAERGREMFIDDKRHQSGDKQYGADEMAEPVREKEYQQYIRNKNMPTPAELATIFQSVPLRSSRGPRLYWIITQLWSNRTKNKDTTLDDLLYTLSGTSNKRKIETTNSAWNTMKSEFMEAYQELHGSTTLYDYISDLIFISSYLGTNVKQIIFDEVSSLMSYANLDTITPKGVGKQKAKLFKDLITSRDITEHGEAFTILSKSLGLFTGNKITKIKKLKRKEEVKDKAKELLDRLRATYPTSTFDEPKEEL